MDGVRAAPTRRIFARIAASLAVVIGALAFSPWTIDWYHHSLIPGGERLRSAIVMPLLLVPVILLAGGGAAGRKLRWAGTLAGVACGAIGLTQLLAQTTSVWLLYAWMFAAACTTAWAVAGIGALRIGERLAVVVLAAVIGLAVALHIAMQLEAWRLLSFGFHDIGHFARALHSAVRGRGMWVDTLNRSLFGEHTFFLLLALVPICKLGADPFLTLVVVSPLVMNGTALGVYWYARRRDAGPGGALLVALAWLLLPVHGCLVLSGGAGFHEAQMAVPLLFCGMAMGELRRWGWAAALMGLAMLAREDVALTVGAWGLYICVFKGRVRLGIAVLVSAAVYLAAMLWVVIPWFRGAPYPHVAFNIGEQITSPLATLHRQLSFVAMLTLPMGLLCFCRWRLALVALPAVAETLLTHNPDFHNIVFHYYIAAIAPLFLAAVNACLDRGTNRQAGATSTGDDTGQAAAELPATGAKDAARPRRLPATARCWLLFVSAYLGQSYLGTGAWTHHPPGIRSDPRLVASYPQIVALREKIGRDRSVAATARIAAHFMNADRLWRTFDGHFADAIVIHDTDANVGITPREYLLEAMKTGEYSPIHAEGQLVAIMKQAGPHSIGRELAMQENPLAKTIEPIEMGEGIRLVGMRIERQADGTARATLIWQGDGTARADYRFGLTAGGVRRGPYYFARGAYPPPVWKEGLFYRDDIALDAGAAEALERWPLEVVLLH